MKINRYLLAAALMTITSVQCVFAETIKQIQIKGNQRVDPVLVQSYLRTKNGDQYDSNILNQDLKGLFATGLFSDISFFFNKKILTIQVSENPIINEIAFEGIKSSSEEIIRKGINLTSRQIVKKSDILKAVDQILTSYHAGGFLNARVIPQIIEEKENRISIIFKIDEGQRAHISKISMIGNKYFSFSDLKSVIDSEEKSSFELIAQYLQSNHIYDLSRIKVDEEKLRRFYFKNGFFDFEFKRSFSELSPNYDGFNLTYQFKEGVQYRVGKIQIDNPYNNLSLEDMISSIPYEVGDVLNQEIIEQSIDILMDYYASKGYPFVQININFVKNSEKGVADVKYIVTPVKKVFIEEIIFEGNYLTQENVIRKQLLFSEGDILNPVLVRRSIKNIRNLGLFEPMITYDKSKGSSPDKVILIFRLVERPFVSFNGGLSYGNTEGFAGNVNLSHDNILGTGIGGRLGALIGTKAKSLMLGINKSGLIKDIDGNFNGNISHDDEPESLYKEFSYIARPEISFNWNEDFKTSIHYTFKHYDTKFFNNIQRNAQNLQYADRQENRYKSAIGTHFIYDTVDSRFNPTEGFRIFAGLDLAGLGGNVNYVKFDAHVSYYIPFGKSEVVLGLKGAYGKIFETNNNYIDFFERYQLGYLSFRGFAVGGIGPRSKITVDEDVDKSSKYTPSGEKTLKKDLATGSTGGLNMYKLTAELSFPFGNDVGVRSINFVDIGSVWGLGTPKVKENTTKVELYPGYETMKLRMSIGTGVQVDIPFIGRFIVGVAKPLIKEDYDKEEVFFFSLGGAM